MLEQVAQDLELDGTEVDITTTAADPIGDQVHLEVGKVHDARPARASRRAPVRVAGSGTQALDEPGWSHRTAEDADDSAIEAIHVVARRPLIDTRAQQLDPGR